MCVPTGMCLCFLSVPMVHFQETKVMLSDSRMPQRDRSSCSVLLLFLYFSRCAAFVQTQSRASRLFSIQNLMMTSPVCLVTVRSSVFLPRSFSPCDHIILSLPSVHPGPNISTQLFIACVAALHFFN